MIAARKIALAVLAGMMLVSPAGAGNGGDAARAASAEYLFTEIASHDAERIVVRAGVRIDGPPGRSYGVYFGIRHDRKGALTTAGGKQFMALAQDLIMPDSGNARWSDLRLPIALADIQAARDLPKDKKTALQVVCGVWDYAAKKYVGSGWAERTPLIVTTDSDGSITSVETFNTRAAVLAANHRSDMVEVKVCELAVRHLRPKTGLKVYRGPAGAGPRRDIFLLGPSQGGLEDARGHFFRTVDSADKARELALLSLAGARIIKTADQYSAIAASVKRLGGKAPHLLRPDGPPGCGVTITEVGGLGFRVDALVLARDSGVYYRRFAITIDGRIGTETIQCIKSPGTDASRRAIKAALKDGATEIVPDPIKVTDKTAIIPAPQDPALDKNHPVE